MPSALETFAENLRRHRETAGISQEELGLRIGVDVSNISRYEAAKRDPSVTMVARLSVGLGIAPADLFVGIDSESP